MNINDPNVALVEVVANALGPLRENVVFVGGCATGLLVTDPGSAPVRATQDVDLVAEVATKVEYYVLTKELKRVGFKEHIGDVACRWRLGDLMVDVMPTDETILGFTNRWYVEAVRQAMPTRLPSGTTIKLVTPPLLVATKLEAFYGRGNGDFGQSHDIEDIINVVNGRPELLDEIAKTDSSLREYLRHEIDELISSAAFLDTLPWHFGPDQNSQARIPTVIERLRQLAGL